MASIIPSNEKAKGKSAKARKVTQPLYEVVVRERAPVIDVAACERIHSCIKLADDPGATPQQVDNAMRTAARMAERMNIKLSDVLALGDPDKDDIHAGHSIATLRRVDGNLNKKVTKAHYVGKLLEACTTYFECKSWTTRRDSSIDFVFYGIREQTVFAVEACCIVYNKMVGWAADSKYKGSVGKGSYCEGVCVGHIRIARQERKDAENKAKAKDKEAMAARIVDEEAQRKAELDRLAWREDDSSQEGSDTTSHTTASRSASPAAGVQCGDAGGQEDEGHDQYPEWHGFSDDDKDEDDDVDMEDDGEDDGEGHGLKEMDWSSLNNSDDDESDKHTGNEIDTHTTGVTTNVDMDRHSTMSDDHPILLPMPVQTRVDVQPVNTDHQAPSSENDGLDVLSEDEEGAEWASHMQLIHFRKQASDIADNYRKKIGIKLYKSRKRKPGKHDQAAYEQGVEDSKLINVHEKALAGEEV